MVRDSMVRGYKSEIGKEQLVSSIVLSVDQDKPNKFAMLDFWPVGDINVYWVRLPLKVVNDVVIRNQKGLVQYSNGEELPSSDHYDVLRVDTV